MKLRHSILIAGAVLAGAFGAAHADLTYTQGSGTTIFDFVCFTTKHCSAHVPVNSAGTEIMTTANPAQVDASTSSQLHADLTAAVPAGTNIIGKFGIDQTTPGTTNGVQDAATGATGSAVPAKAGYVGVIDAVGGNLAGLTADPCQTSVKSSLPITLATAAVKVIATGVSAKKIYICAIDLTNNAADSVAVFEATTGTTCATSPVAVAGAGTSVATAATGYNFSANGGISKGNGGFQVMQTTVNNNDLCIAQSAATQLTGNITYVTR